MCSPGIGNAYESVVNTCAWCVTITLVGRFEVPEEPEPDQRHREQLDDVLRRIPTRDVEHRGQDGKREPDGKQTAGGPQRQREPHERERRRNQYGRDERDVPPVRRVPQPRVDDVVRGEDRDDA